MSDESQLFCNFCGKGRDAVDKLIAGPNVYICNECIDISYNIITSTAALNKNKQTNDKIPSPREINEHFDQHIIGHSEAKMMLSVAAYNHYKRIMSDEANGIEKSNILIVGPTGTGKTLFAKTLAKKMDVPFAIADATSLTESGYVGDDVESIVERLLAATGYDVEKAQRGIIYIDEIDKKARKSDKGAQSRDVSGEGVQQALLRLIEGTTVKIKVGGRRMGAEETVDFDTTNVLFIVGGAFVGIEKHIEDRKKGKTRMGFNSEVMTKDDRKALLAEVTPEDIVNYGLIPEFVGRLPILGVLDPLNEEQMKMILTDVENSLLEQVTQLIEMDKISIEFNDDYLTTVAGLALTRKLGARALKSIVEQSMISIMYRAPDLHDSGVTKIIFDKYPVGKNNVPTLVYSDGTQTPDTDYKLYRGKHVK